MAFKLTFTSIWCLFSFRYGTPLHTTTVIANRHSRINNDEGVIYADCVKKLANVTGCTSEQFRQV